MSAYEDRFSDGIEVIGRALRFIGFACCITIAIPFMTAFAIVMAPFALLGWIARRMGFQSQWWPGTNQ